jgi:hypothetical protein
MGGKGGHQEETRFTKAAKPLTHETNILGHQEMKLHSESCNSVSMEFGFSGHIHSGTGQV